VISVWSSVPISSLLFRFFHCLSFF
jgi:hypothetical protein